MIALTKFHGRLGNQLFQYAYIRSQAKRLGTKFYCPPWIGDEIYNLEDQNERTSEFSPLSYYSSVGEGFKRKDLEISDETSIDGFFQSEKYFKKNDVLKWFTLKSELAQKILSKYPNIDFSKCTAVHVRLADYNTPQLDFYTPRPFYFKKALTSLGVSKNVLIFSDEPEKAKEYLKGIEALMKFMDVNPGYEDLYLISQCQNFIASPSSYSWWGAYLNQNNGKIIVPDSWSLPGHSQNKDIFVPGWIRLRAHRGFWDNVYVRYLPNWGVRIYQKLGRILRFS